MQLNLFAWRRVPKPKLVSVHRKTLLQISRRLCLGSGAEGLLWPGMARAIPKTQTYFSYPRIYWPSPCIREAKASGWRPTPRAPCPLRSLAARPCPSSASALRHSASPRLRPGPRRPLVSRRRRPSSRRPLVDLATSGLGVAASATPRAGCAGAVVRTPLLGSEP